MPNTKLGQFFQNQQGEVFLDRNGKIFEALLDYLRNGREELPNFSERFDQQRFEQELKFWGVAPKNTVLHKSTERRISPLKVNKFKAAQLVMDTQVDRIINYNYGAYESTNDSLGFPIKLQKILNQEPSNEVRKAKAKWLQLGPLKLEEIVTNSKVKINY